jgi:hypothetical protein
MPSLADWDNWIRTTISEFNKRQAIQQAMTPIAPATALSGGTAGVVPTQPLQHLQMGGAVDSSVGIVPGQGMGDKVPIAAEPGEIVIPNNIGEMKIKDLMLGVISLNKTQDNTLQPTQNPVQKFQYGGEVLTDEEKKRSGINPLPAYTGEALSGGKTMPTYNAGMDNTPVQNTVATPTPEGGLRDISAYQEGHIFTNQDLPALYGIPEKSALTDEQNLAIIDKNRTDAGKIDWGQYALNKTVNAMTPEQQHTYYLQKAQDERMNDPNIQLANIESNIQYKQSQLDDLQKQRAFENFSNDSFVMQNRLGKLQKHLESYPNDKVAQAAYDSNQQALSEMKRDYMGLIGKPQTLDIAKAQENRLATEQGRVNTLAERKQAIEEGQWPTEKKLKEAQADYYSGRNVQAEAAAKKLLAEAVLTENGDIKLPNEEKLYRLYEQAEKSAGRIPLLRLDWYEKRHQANLQGNPLVAAFSNAIANNQRGEITLTPSDNPPQLAPDGNYYIRDLNRPGKYLKVG